ncbi:MAG: hypothetical protein ABEJ81_08155 [Haloferacaceae archaeon]
MDLGEIAAGIEVTAEQRDRGVTTVDGREEALVDRLAPHADALPCTPEAAATVLRSHTAGTSVGESAREAGIAPMTAAKALHRCGVEGVDPLTPTAREVVCDWLAGDLPRSEAVELAGGDEAEFALAAYVATHDPVPALVTAAARVGGRPAGAVAKRDSLAETMSDPTELR